MNLTDNDKYLLAWIIIEGLQLFNLKMNREQQRVLQGMMKSRHLNNMDHIAEVILKAKMEREKLSRG
ncbi:MAG TPA: hypothetical protein VLH56_08555 [Dissulfurispiraceae bacterium]|nr:hypothetical protein [Dissulfurispiraceae bacterium]